MGSTIELKTGDGHTLSAYQAGLPQAEHGLVVVQEIFGVNPHMRRLSDTFAAAGYSVIAPALFDRVERGVELGYGPEDIARGRELRGRLTEQGIIADITAAAKALGLNRRGIVGYCFGGTVAWYGATRTELFKAAVGWYGGAIAAVRNERPNCPVQLHFGDADASIPLSDVEAIRTAQPGVEIYIYPGAGHGFGCDERGSYNAEAAKLAQSRTLEFLAKHLA
jgi:carboxymethylenebutenolidase